MRRFASLFAVPIALGLVACGGDDEDRTDLVVTTVTRSDAAPAPTTAEDKPTEAAPSTDTANEPVRFQTSDGVVIQGHLYSSGGPKRKVVVLAHEFPGDQTAWTDFAQELVGRGVDALTFDFRGYGETGGERDVSKIDLDLEAAARFIGSREYEQVYIFGASMGGTATLKVAARLDLAGVVTVSSPPDIMGLDARDDVALVTEPKLFIAGSEDEGGAYEQVVDAFMAASPEPKQRLVLEDASEHGTDLLRGDSGAALEDALFDFLEET